MSEAQDSAVYSLEQSKWWNMMKLRLSCKYAKDEAAKIVTHAGNLLHGEYEPTIGTELAQTETALSEALLAVKLARKQYEKFAKHPKPRLVAESA